MLKYYVYYSSFTLYQRQRTSVEEEVFVNSLLQNRFLRKRGLQIRASRLRIVQVGSLTSNLCSTRQTRQGTRLIFQQNKSTLLLQIQMERIQFRITKMLTYFEILVAQVNICQPKRWELLRVTKVPSTLVTITFQTSQMKIWRLRECKPMNSTNSLLTQTREYLPMNFKRKSDTRTSIMKILSS